MPRCAFIAGLLAALLLSTPLVALTAKEKMVTCKFGADDQKLTGAARNAFLKKCMASADAPPPKAKAQPKNQPKKMN